MGSVKRYLQHSLFQVSEFGGELQGQTSPGFSWVLFSGRLADPIEPKALQSKQFKFNKCDEEKVGLLLFVIIHFH